MKAAVLAIALSLTGVIVMSSVAGCASQSKSCCTSAASCCNEAAAERDETPRDVTVLGDDFAPIRESFNAMKDRWRVVALVSPTCSECVYGAEAVRKEVIDRYPADRVGAICIWIPMLSTDNEKAARASATIFPPERAALFYDRRQSVGWAYARDTFAGFIDRARKSLPQGHHLAEAFNDPQQRDRPQWDLYMLYAPGVRWDQAPPAPTHWIRHCGRTDGQNSTYWVDSPDAPPREGNLFEAMRQMADGAIGAAQVSDASSGMKIELLGFPSCPNTPAIRKNLESALRELKRDPGIVEVNLETLAPSDPRRGWGAPTILINGRDLMGMSPPTSNALSCRTYPDGVPAAEDIARRLKRATERAQSGSREAPLAPASSGTAPEHIDPNHQIVFAVRGFT